jgi:hypothetical protein
MSEKLLAAGSATLIAAGSLLGATPAQAATAADCGTHPGATVELLAGNVCSVTFDSEGDYDFTAPAGVTKLEALVIAAGSGAEWCQADTMGYAGGAGEVLYVSNLVESAAQSVVVGTDDGADSELNSTVARGADGDDSGSGNLGLGFDVQTFGNYNVFGGGAKTPAGAVGNVGYAGEGFLSSDPDLVGVNNNLFPVIVGDLVLGQGGSGIEILEDSSYGSGGSTDGAVGEADGYGGAVIFRYMTPGTLASTGVDATAIGIGAGALLAGGVVLGAAAAVRRARAKN